MALEYSLELKWLLPCVLECLRFALSSADGSAGWLDVEALPLTAVPLPLTCGFVLSSLLERKGGR